MFGQQASTTAWDSVGRILGTSPTTVAGYVRYNLPRRDLTVRIGDVTVAPALALGAWAGFSGEPNDATMMGDLVLTAAELGPVLTELAHQRIGVSAIHNHIVGEQPEIIYVHILGHGNALDLATRLDRALTRTGTPRPVAAAPPVPLTIDTAAVFEALGRHGTARGNVVQVGFVLVSGTVTMGGRTMTPALAYGSPVNVQMVSPSRAVATGDFAVRDSSVAAVLDALTAHGITATAMHSHMIGDSPHLDYIHFWADGPLPDVLRGLRAAVDAGH
ncbi:MAG: hypothetical protein AUI89_03160 [Gemmatimonadetes bacterium 13_1_40CM_3_65_8]|nr:MAG: hypothetical protein AUI89_03160 [Gemmatimonadetes bacterium 13_1_40CM_3_65_8]